MKICVISTTIIPCPPKGYSGLEQLAYQQAVGLANKGHEVLLVAPNQSTVPNNVELHGTTLYESEKQAYSGYWQRLNNYDVIIDNSWEKWSYILKLEKKLPKPILGILHAPAATMYRIAPPVTKPCLVAISEDQAVEARSLWNVNVEVAYNGVDENFYKPFYQKRNDSFLFLARMCRIKGPHIAVEMSEKFGFNLDLVGDDTITGEPDYAAMLKAKVSNKIKYHGGVNRDVAVKYFNTNKCLLHMNKEYKEPFGLAPVEAQLCGMPVISFDNGAMRETIQNGKTGFIVRSEEELIDILKCNAIDSINSNDCRKWALKFSVSNMVDRYESLANHAIEKGGW